MTVNDGLRCLDPGPAGNTSVLLADVEASCLVDMNPGERRKLE